MLIVSSSPSVLSTRNTGRKTLIFIRRHNFVEYENKEPTIDRRRY